MARHRLHLLAVPHTETSLKFSHCAFTQKVVRFIPMMQAQGCEVIHYGIGDENPGADEHVKVMDSLEQQRLLGHTHEAAFSGKAFYGDDADVGKPVYHEFNRIISGQLKRRVRREDFVCMPFGHAHQAGTRDHAGTNVETGIGYPTTCEQFRIFESYAWLHRLGGVDKREGTDYEWVIPNYFDVAQWPLGIGQRKYFAFLGRIGSVKGLDIIKAIAELRPDCDFVFCGQGDPSPWLDPKVPNLRYLRPLIGMERAVFLGNAIALLAPTRFIEPFCGVTVEANLCGTPALTSHFGAFTETIQPGLNGQRCRTLGDWMAAIEWALHVQDGYPSSSGDTGHAAIRDWAMGRYSMEAVGPQYRDVFDQLRDVRSGKGYYTMTSKIGPIPPNKHSETRIDRLERVAETIAASRAREDAALQRMDATLASSIQTARDAGLMVVSDKRPDDRPRYDSHGAQVTPVDVARWNAAQVYEQRYWLDNTDGRKKFVDEREREQHVFYRGLMRIAPQTTENKRVLDIGCGPYSIGLDPDLSLAHLTAVDPAHYAPEDEAQYAARGNVQRIYEKVEDLVLRRGAVAMNEVWCYNLLQHVVDPAKCIEVASRFAAPHGATFRIFEWCHVPTDDGHPHILTKEWLRSMLAAHGWEMWKEMSGTEEVTGWKPTEFYAAVWVRK